MSVFEIQDIEARTPFGGIVPGKASWDVMRTLTAREKVVNSGLAENKVPKEGWK